MTNSARAPHDTQTVPNRFAPFLSAALTAVLTLALFAKLGVFPFGELTLLMSDLDVIYAEFLAELVRGLRGDGDLLYSFHAGLGLNTLAMYVFYVSSPFYAILALIPDAYFLDGITLITLLKFAAAAWTMTRFLQRRRSGFDRFAILFGVCYGLCGYAISYSFSMIWLDAVILLPVIAGCIDGFLGEDRFFPLIFAYALLFFSGFYPGYMAGLGSALYFLYRLFSHDRSVRERLHTCLRFALAVVLAAGMNAAFILPTAHALSNNMGLFGQNAPAFETLFDLFDLPWKLFNSAYDGYKDVLPFLYGGLLPTVALAFFFGSRKIAAREKILAAAMLATFILSFHLAPLDFVWHAFDHPSWFPFRYAFVFPFCLIWLAYEGITRHDGQTAPLRTWLMALTGWLVLATKLTPEKVTTGFFYLNLALLVAVSLLLARWVTSQNAEMKRHTAGTVAMTLAFVTLVALDLFINADTTFTHYRPHYTRRADYKAFRARYAEDIQSLHPRGGAFYRIEKDTIRTYNDPMNLGYPGIGNFSSVASLAQSTLLKKLGYDCYATWCMYRGGTPFADSLLSIRYIMSADERSPYPAFSATVRENEDAFPVAYFVSTSPEDFPRLSADDNPLTLHQEIAHAIDPTVSDLYRRVPVAPGVPTNLKQDTTFTEGRRFLREALCAPAEMRYALTFPEAGTYVLEIPNVSLNYDVTLDDEPLFSAQSSYTPHLVTLTAQQDGEIAELRVVIEKTDDYFDEVRLWKVDRNALSRLRQSLRIVPTEFDGRRTFTFRIENLTDLARTLMTSIPYDAGWRAELNGRAIPVESVLSGGLIALRIPDDGRDGELKLTYRPPMLMTGVTITVITLLLLGVVWLLRRRK